MKNATTLQKSFLEKYFPLMVIIFFIILLSAALAIEGFSQQATFQKTNEPIEYGGEYPIGRNDANNPCITPEQYTFLEKQCTDNIKLLGLENVGQKSSVTTLFNWPLKMANGLNDYSYYFIANYLDQDPTAGLKDWNCGAVTYDGHRGNDISIMPYPFYKMDNNQVEIIAAAPGTIVNKADGNFDKNCATNNLNPNYIAIQHADGSVAIYYHMKMNSLTAKIIGQTVVAGEYLGVVGSSGSSTGPHLHFEVWSSNTANTLKDAFAGPCNSLNANSWWAVQKPNTEPAIVKAQVNTIVPVLPACPATETPNEDSCFASGTSVKFVYFIRNETSGLVANLRIVNPNGTTFTSWVHNSNNNYLASYYIATRTLPAIAGTYTFEAVYNGDTCSKSFKINCNATGISETNLQNNISVYPNPTRGVFNLQMSQFENVQMKIYNIYGECIHQQICKLSSQQIDLSSQPNGIYFLQLKSGQGTAVKKIILNK